MKMVSHWQRRPFDKRGPCARLSVADGLHRFILRSFPRNEELPYINEHNLVNSGIQDELQRTAAFFLFTYCKTIIIHTPPSLPGLRRGIQRHTVLIRIRR
jgi:hypothetical protein